MPQTRRSALKLLTSGLTALLGAVVAAPAVVLLSSPLRKKTIQGGEEPIAVAELSHLPEGVPVAAKVTAPALTDAWTRFLDVPLGAVWLVRRGDAVACYSSTCPHAGCFVDYEPKANQFNCPCHGSSFDLHGQTIAGPSPRPLDTLDTELKGGKVLVRFRRFRQAKVEKEEA